jgi:transposase InsO family protein
LYQSARTTPLSRAFLLAEADRIGVTRAARNMGVSRNTVYRWRRRAGELTDRSCRPHHSPRRTAAVREAAVLAARLEWRWGPDRLGPLCGLSRRTVYRILRRFSMHRLRTVFPVERPRRGVFTIDAPGELVAIDIKSLGSLARGGGRHAAAYRARDKSNLVRWAHAHCAIDAASRAAYVELLPSLGSADCAAFLRRTVAHFDARGIRVRRVLTDNGTGYKKVFASACADLGLRWTRTKPYHPWTNGRAEAFIGTLQRECLYLERFTTEDERRYALARWLAFYNADRPHTALGGLTPSAWLRARGVPYV